MTHALPTATIGNTGLKVTRLGMGTAQLGWLFSPVKNADAHAVLNRAHELGINHFDTSPLYGRGVAETRVGHVAKAWNAGSFLISSKVGYAIYKDDPVPDGESTTSIEYRGRDYSYDGAMRLVEGSLKRTGQNKIDILLIHDPDDHMQDCLDGTYKALRKLRDQGVVKAIGAGMNFADKLLWLAQRAQFDCFLCAGRYTLLDQVALAELMPECEKQNIGIFIGGPYNSGILANPYAADAKFNYDAAGREWVSRAQAIDKVCQRHGVSLKAAAMQFPLAHPVVVNVLTGARSVKELEENHAAFLEPIPKQLWQELKHEKLLGEDVPTA